MSVYSYSLVNRTVCDAYTAFQADILIKTAKLNLTDTVYQQIFNVILWYAEGKLRSNVAEYTVLYILSKHDPVLASEFKLYFEYCHS